MKTEIIGRKFDGFFIQPNKSLLLFFFIFVFVKDVIKKNTIQYKKNGI